MRRRIGCVAATVACLAVVPMSAAAQAPTLDAVSWLQGCWLASSGSSSVEEVWMAPVGGLMMGMSRSLREGAATGFEFVLLQDTEEGLVFSARPSGQAPADFTASAATVDLLRVENPAHDFPQKIEYARLSRDSVVASVFGDVNADAPAFQLRYGRAPCTPEPRR